MVKGFVAGVLWGGVVAGAGLGVVSVMTPMHGAPEQAAQTEAASAAQADAGNKTPDKPAAVEDSGLVKPELTAPKVDEAVAEAAEPMEAEPLPKADETAATAAPEADDKPATELAPEADAIQESPEKPAVAEGEGQAAQPVAEAEATASDSQPVITPAPKTEMSEVAEAPVQSPAEEAAAPSLPKPEGAPATDAPEAAPSAEPAPDAPEAQAEANDSLLKPAPGTETPMPATIVPDPAPVAEAAIPDGTATLAPDGGLEDKVAGVTTGRLPSIGGEEAAPDGSADVSPAADLPPYRRFARSFENPGAKPLFAILLVDPGTPEIDRAQLAALAFPVTFVVDPLAANATDAAAIYRAAGQEVVMLATGIPEGAKASDLEQTFAAYATALPEAVAVMDLASKGFQDKRALAADVVGLLKSQGRGVITYDRGLNAADQSARREDVPAALVFRSLDDEGEDAPLIRRYLDRAAFKAAQEGEVVVVGTARPETIAALLEWSIEGRASSVALAPASAVLSVE